MQMHPVSAASTSSRPLSEATKEATARRNLTPCRLAVNLISSYVSERVIQCYEEIPIWSCQFLTTSAEGYVSKSIQPVPFGKTTPQNKKVVFRPREGVKNGVVPTTQMYLVFVRNLDFWNYESKWGFQPAFTVLGIFII